MTQRYVPVLIKPLGELTTKESRNVILSAASQDGKSMAELIRDALMSVPSVQTQMKVKLADKAKSGEPK